MKNERKSKSREDKILQEELVGLVVPSKLRTGLRIGS